MVICISDIIHQRCYRQSRHCYHWQHHPQQQNQQQQQQQWIWCTRETRSRSQPDAFAGFHNTPKRKLADSSQPQQQQFNPTTAKPKKKHQHGRQIKF
jgi:hypothetical protein